MRALTTSLLIFSALLTSGCKNSGMLAKREAEKCCPTDIRKTVPWCAGEDAIFQCPCQPSQSFYGHKPTCWGIWPASGAEWRDMHCGEIHHAAVLTELKNKNEELIELPQVAPTPGMMEYDPPQPEEAPSDAQSANGEAEMLMDAEVQATPELKSDEGLPRPLVRPIPLPEIGAE